MVLRLYKGCRLSQSYDEVFYPRKINNVDIHAAYLATLQSVDIELGEVYLTRDGMLSFDWDFWALGNIENYNYMRLSDENLTSYAFINSSTYINGLATVRYSVDVWATYAPGMTLGSSLMTATRFPRENAPFALPLAYTSNKYPTESVSNTSGDVSVFIQYQLYNLDQSGVVTYREVFTGLLTWNETPSAGWDGPFDYKGNYETAVKQLLKFVAYSSGGAAFDHDAGQTVGDRYEIKSAWIIPAEWGDEVKAFIDDNTVQNEYILLGGSAVVSFRIWNFSDMQIAKTYTINANPLTIGVGTHTNIIPLIYNGTAHNIRVILSTSPTDLSIELEVDAGRNTITSDFELDIPIAAASAAETQQAEIARRLKEQQADAQLWQTSFQMIAGVGQIAVGAAAVASGGAAGLGISQIVSGVGAVGAGIMNINQITAQHNANNAKVYTSNAGTRCTRSPALNSPRGICTLTLEASNGAEVNTAIAQSGYTVYYNTTDLLPDAADDATLTQRVYDVLKYSFVRIYGGFTEEIREMLKTILLDGARVWYAVPS